MRIVNWNVEWATLKSRRGPIILNRICDQNPEIICLTEGYLNFLPDNGHVVTSDADYGYPIVKGRRKVILWSRMPWTNVNSLRHQSLPPGRFVRADTETSIGTLSVVGVGVPWNMAHVSSGRRNRQPWEDHLNYLSGLDEILVKEKEPLVIVGDFNQRVPRKRAPINVYHKMEEVITGNLSVLTTGEIAGIGKQTVNHIIHSRDLEGTRVFGLSNTSEQVKHLSDHYGIVADLELA